MGYMGSEEAAKMSMAQIVGGRKAYGAPQEIEGLIVNQDKLSSE